MQEYTGPSLSNYLMVVGFLFTMILGFYYLKKNRHIISQKINTTYLMSLRGAMMLRKKPLRPELNNFSGGKETVSPKYK